MDESQAEQPKQIPRLPEPRLEELRAWLEDLKTPRFPAGMAPHRVWRQLLCKIHAKVDDMVGEAL